MKLSEGLERPFLQPLRSCVEAFGKKKARIATSIFFLLGSFFLAQAVLFDAAVPFFLPIWALARVRFRRHLVWVFIGGMAGSAFLGLGQALIHLLQIILFNIAIRFPTARKAMPLTVAGTVLMIQLGWQLLMHGGSLPIEVQLFIGFEVILASFMTFFLFTAFPTADQVFFGQWTPERLGAACIIGAMTLTGMKGIMIGNVAVVGVLIHLAILLAAAVGGLAASTTIAMIIATIVGVAELSFTGMMAVYGMTGFFAGALSRFGKLGTAVGAVSVSVFFLMYDLTLPLDLTHFTAIGVATILFFIIPTKKLAPIKGAFFPGENEDASKRQRWLTERLDEQLNEFHQFTEFMSTLVEERVMGRDGSNEQPINAVTPSVCHSCFRYAKCWESEDEDMKRLVKEWESTNSGTKKSGRLHIEEKIKFKCIRFTGLVTELEERSASRLLSGQLQHGRKMLALQLRDMSTHLNKVMNDIKEDLAVYKPAEEEIGRRFDARNIQHFQIDVLSDEQGNRRIVCCIPEKRSEFETDTTVAERVILPELEAMYNEPFQIEKSVVKQDPFPHIRITFSSAVRFSLEYGVMTTSGKESFHAGDAYEVFQIHDGLSAVLLSDGMGQDLNAYRESRKVIRLMRECLDRKMDPETAMHTLHYMMSLNGLDDMYATLDLALIDLQDGRLWSWKAGSMSTYIKRGDEFIRLDSKSVPVGFLPSFSVEAKNEKLKSGDILVMMTDGMFNGETALDVQETTLYNTLEKYDQYDCEVIADKIMNEMERRFQAVEDDRTVLVMRVDHVVPEWSSFTPYSQSNSREKVVS